MWGLVLRSRIPGDDAVGSVYLLAWAQRWLQVTAVCYLHWKISASHSSCFALNLHSKSRSKRVSDLKILIQPFSLCSARQSVLGSALGCATAGGDVPALSPVTCTGCRAVGWSVCPRCVYYTHVWIHLCVYICTICICVHISIRVCACLHTYRDTKACTFLYTLILWLASMPVQ